MKSLSGFVTYFILCWLYLLDRTMALIRIPVRNMQHWNFLTSFCLHLKLKLKISGPKIQSLRESAYTMTLSWGLLANLTPQQLDIIYRLCLDLIPELESCRKNVREIVRSWVIFFSFSTSHLNRKLLKTLRSWIDTVTSFVKADAARLSTCWFRREQTIFENEQSFWKAALVDRLPSIVLTDSAHHIESAWRAAWRKREQMLFIYLDQLNWAFLRYNDTL